MKTFDKHTLDQRLNSSSRLHKLQEIDNNLSSVKAWTTFFVVLAAASALLAVTSIIITLN